MKRTFVLFLLIASAARLHGQSPISGPSYYARSVAFANLSTPLAGNFRYCTNCTATAPCAGSGSGAWAFRTGSVWNCTNGSAATGGTFLAADGTAAAPSYSFASTGNGDNGMFLSAANALGFATAGVERWTINASGGFNCVTDGGCVVGNGVADPATVSVKTGVDYRGATSGTTRVVASAVAGSTTLTLPAVTDTLVGKTTTDTLTNKTLTTPVLTAPTATTIQTSGNVGIGKIPNVTTGRALDIQVNGSQSTLIDVNNTDASGTAALAGLRATADTAQGTLRAYGTGNTGAAFGVTLGGYVGLLTTGNGFILGPVDAKPFILGTNSTATLTLSAAQDVTLPLLTPTAGTMTTTASTSEATATSTRTCRSWTNAMVTALPTTAGDIAWGTLPAKTIVRNAYVVITGAAAGPATVTVAVGRVSATYIDYIVASDAKAAANTVYGDASGERGTNLTSYDLPSYTGTTVINAHFVSSGANLSTVTGSTGMVCLTLDKLP